MGKSSSDASTKTISTFTTNTTTNVGLQGNDVANILNIFTSYALQTQHNYLESTSPQFNTAQHDQSDSTQKQSETSTILYITLAVAGVVLAIVLLR